MPWPPDWLPDLLALGRDELIRRREKTGDPETDRRLRVAIGMLAALEGDAYRGMTADQIRDALGGGHE